MNVELCVIVVFTLQSVGAYKLLEVELPEDLQAIKVFTDDDISKFDGSNGQPTYMGVKGVVFDVSSAPEFYGKGSNYNALTGIDCTRAVAKMSLEPEDLNKDISDLDNNFLKSLDDVYKGTYLKKYPIVGYMDYLVEKEIAKRKLKHDL